MLCLAVLPSLPGFHHRLHFCVCNECCQRWQQQQELEIEQGRRRQEVCAYCHLPVEQTVAVYAP